MQVPCSHARCRGCKPCATAALLLARLTPTLVTPRRRCNDFVPCCVQLVHLDLAGNLQLLEAPRDDEVLVPWNLPHLTFLDLCKNGWNRGELPSSIGSCTALRALRLGDEVMLRQRQASLFCCVASNCWRRATRRSRRPTPVRGLLTRHTWPARHPAACDIANQATFTVALTTLRS